MDRLCGLALDRIRKPFTTRALPKTDKSGLTSFLQKVEIITLVTCAVGYGVHLAKVKGIDIWDTELLHSLGLRI
ncbi:hypothetical protein ElyMa_003901800 [Elysia marginata]|uniref:Uncharacterized protein n=1 Tax=Elysia marginata TaxID=1093978 RepID=A0AAV4FQ23_9GAST|nr:hypothetical protein ElyMa_003901800 [Elysia marginata]